MNYPFYLGIKVWFKKFKWKFKIMRILILKFKKELMWLNYLLYFIVKYI